MKTLAVVLLLFACASCAPRHETAWDPQHGDPHLDLGEGATLHTDANSTIRILVDAEHNYAAIKSLASYRCYLLLLGEASMTPQQLIDSLNNNLNPLEALMTTAYRPSTIQLSHSSVQHLFGHRVAHFCLHSPSFMLEKIAAQTTEATVTHLIPQ